MTEWRTVERPSAFSVEPRAQVEGDIPDVHVITVRERRVTVDYPTIIQHNVNTDVIELDLDGEWGGMSVVLVLGPCGEATELAWHGSPLTLPPALAEDTGGIDVSVVGYSADGLTRLVTVAAPSLLSVIKSGCTVGEAPDDDTPDLIGQLVAAGDAANKAAQAANTAATAANGAAGTANTAASAANTAAGKANTAATAATNAAGAASDAAEGATQAAQTANAAAEAAGAAAEAARGNVLKGTLGPDPLLSADDAYATTPRRLTVYGNTRQNLWVNPSGTQNGVTVTPNADGSVTLSGTNTSNDIWIGYAKRYVLKPGSTYTLSMDKALPSVVAFRVEPRDAGGNVISPGSITVESGVTTQTATVPSNTAYVNMLLVITANVGTAISGTYRIMLNEGSEAQPWCPPGLNSVDELSVVTAGKNLADIVSNKISYSKAIYLTAGTKAIASRDQNTALPSDNDRVIYVHDGMTDEYTGAPLVFSGTDTGHLVSSVFNVTKSGLYKFIFYTTHRTNFQLELSSAATAYEPSQFTETTIDLQGHTLNSLPDGTCDELTIDATGAVTLVKRVGSVDSTNSFGAYGAAAPCFGCSDALYSTASASGNMSANGLKVYSDGNTRLWPNYSAGLASNEDITRVYVKGAEDDAMASDLKDTMASVNALVLYPLLEPKTVSLPPVTLPTLPAPTVNVFADAESSGTGYAMGPDMGMEYERDVTIAFDKLQAQVSALNILEATND